MGPLALLSMLNPHDIRELCLRKYPDFLNSLITGDTVFPLAVRFGKPSLSKMDFASLNQEIQVLDESSLGYRIEWREINNRRWGRQRIPERVWIENEEDFLQVAGKHREVQCFKQNVALARTQCPKIIPWISTRAIKVVDHAADWPDLLNVCCYFLDHPQPCLYIRELPVPVHTKFIENHEGILAELLGFLLPPESQTNAQRFEERFGLLFDEPLIRLRILDKALNRELGIPLIDVSMPLREFQSLEWGAIQIVITENKMNFLTLPEIPRCVGVFGGGGAVGLLAKAQWLQQCNIVYWGDLDGHGFHILARLRKLFPNVESVMMDCQTLNAYAVFLVDGKPVTEDLSELMTGEEKAAYCEIIKHTKRLEQEKIPYAYAKTQLFEKLK